MSSLYRNALLLKVQNWEYWPWQLFYIPIFFYFIWLVIKSRSLFFFFNSNPGIESGGLLIESKKKILDLLPAHLIPKTEYFEYPSSLDEVIESMKTKLIRFPLIVKPNYGERGWKVEKIEDVNELKVYLKNLRIDFLIQEFIDYPIELGVFYYRMPGEYNGKISSIVIKELLFVIGDGRSSVRELILENSRAFIHFNEIKKRHPDLMNLIPLNGEKIELVPIGNHSRGTTFLDGCHLISPELTSVFNKISLETRGFNYGRFDVRCKSIEELNKGRNFKILELNGAKSEPAHIYQPGFSIRSAYKTIFFHWNILYQISIANKNLGIAFPSYKEGMKTWRKYKFYKRLRRN